jgi:hypothetical protein
MTSAERRPDLGVRLVRVLERYIGRILVHSVLHQSQLKLGIPDGPLRRADLEPLVEEAMVGLRLFCPPERLPDLMVDLASLCSEARG